MCGRFSLSLPHQEIRRVPGHDNLNVDEWIDESQFVPRYNIAPRSQAPVLRRKDSCPSNVDTVQYVLHSMKWGLVPHWSKFEDKTLSTTNARSENLIEGGGMWSSIKGKKRCAVLCQGYYEWLTRGKDKLPHFIKHQNSELMLMAGLYDCVTLEGQSTPLWTFSIVTTTANKQLDWLHCRQPVILSTRKALDAWLDTSSQNWTPELTKLVEPCNNISFPLECYQVPKEVGKVGTESPTFIEPISSRKDGIQALFMKQKQSQASKTQATQTDLKRPRGQSSIKVIDHTIISPPTTPTKRRKVAKEPSEDPDVIILDGPPTPREGSTKHYPVQPVTKKESIQPKVKLAMNAKGSIIHKSPKKSKNDLGTSSLAKITSSFNKSR